MNTIEDFKNAPAGAIATHTDGSRAMKINVGGWGWVTPTGVYYGDKEMAYWGFTLDAPAPTSAREALDLAWELAHPVKEGQVIPAGTVYLVSRNGERPATMRTNLDQFASKSDETNRRTLEPLPDPEPDWLDAPAVLASLDGWHRDQRVVFLPTDSNDRWVRPGTGSTFHWNELRDVTPLYPKGQEA